jgi:phospholipid/cholesterol/gamma-HCH transport system permease protein
MNLLLAPVKAISNFGTLLIEQISVAGKLTVLSSQIVFWLFHGKLNRKNIIEQLNEIGVNSIPVIAVCSLFAGMVLVVQVGKQFASISAVAFIGGTVGLSLTRELAPLIAAVVIAGRNGSAMAAELGTMKVTEQIDALVALSVNPVSYLIIPRVIACIIMLPILTIFANIIGLLGGVIVAISQVGISSSVYFNSVVDNVTVTDFVSGVIKAAIFGTIIGVVASYKGLTCEGGAEGVGKATTGSVVMIITLLLISNYFLSSLFFTYQKGMG